MESGPIDHVSPTLPLYIYISDFSSETQQTQDCRGEVKEGLSTKVNNLSMPPRDDTPGESHNSSDHTPMEPPPQPHWEQVLKRFDEFECTITFTTQEEIMINTTGLWNEVRSLNSRIDTVEKSSASNETKLSSLNQKNPSLKV